MQHNYFPLGLHCEKNIDDCSNNPCANGGLCIDLIGNFKCQCPRGYYGPRCMSDFNECASNPCRHGATCVDEIDRFQCHCPLGMKNIHTDTKLYLI